MRACAGRSLWIALLGLLIIVALFAFVEAKNEELDRRSKITSAKRNTIKFIDNLDNKSKGRLLTPKKKLHKKSKRKKSHRTTLRKKKIKLMADEPSNVLATNSPDVVKKASKIRGSKKEYSITDKLAGLLPHIAKRKCGTCLWQECPSINAMRQRCPSGIVRDQCNCCAQCANGVGMPCYLSSFAPLWLASCGDDLECIPVIDETKSTILDVDEWGGNRQSEGICSCTDQTPVCGSNNVTYDNICEFREAAARVLLHSKIAVKIIENAPCNAGPKIDFSSVDISERIGAIVSFRCEISGFPLPRIQWFKSKNVKKKTDEVELPGYMSNAVTQVRGGPGKYQLTTWLTLDKVKDSDDGEYVCRSTNDYGTADGNALLKVN